MENIKVPIKPLASILLVGLSTIFFYLIYHNSNNGESLLALIFFTFIVLVMIFIYNGIDLLSLMSFLVNVLLIPIFIQYVTNQSYGLLELNLIPLHLKLMILGIFLFNITVLFLSIVTEFKKNELELLSLNKKVKKNSWSIYFCNITAIIFSFVSFPRGFSQVSGNERFQMLLPGHAWNQLVIVALIFNLRYVRKYKSVQLTYLLCIMWFLFHGERADIAGLVLGIICYWVMKQGKILTLKNLGILLVGLSIVVILNLVGNIRIGLTNRSLLTSLLTTPTISDVAYLYNTAIDYSLSFAHTHGQIFVQNLLSAIPFYNSAADFSSIISLSYNNPGGEPFLAEPIMDFGMWSVPVMVSLDILFYRAVIVFKNDFFKYEYLLLLFAVPRIVWYGRSFVYTSVLFFVPLMFLITSILYKVQNKK